MKKSDPDYSSLGFSWNSTMMLHGWVLTDLGYTFPNFGASSPETLSYYTWESETVDVELTVG